MPVTPPMQEDHQRRLEELTQGYLDAIEAIAPMVVPSFASADRSAQRATCISMAVQAFGMKRSHPPDMDMRAIFRAMGMAFGSLLVDMGEIGRATAISLFNGGITYALDNTLQAAKPEGHA